MGLVIAARVIVFQYPALAVVAFVLILLALKRPRGQLKHLPPGPRGIPFFGNILELTGDKWLTFTDLKDKYGPIIQLTAVGQRLIVLNTLQAANELLNDKARVTSHRPASIVVGIMTGNLMLPFLNPGGTWHRMRRACQDGLRPGIVPIFQPALYRGALALSVHMLRDSSKTEWYEHIQRSVAASTIRVIYGKEVVDGETDGDVMSLNEYVERLTRCATPGAHLVEFFPWLQIFPKWMSPWRKMADLAFKVDSETFKRLHMEAKKTIGRGTNRPSIVSILTERSKLLGLTEAEEYWLAGAVFTGAQTMTGVCSWWLMAMILYPDVQRRAHEEIDRIVDKGRLPTFEDCEKMPYMQAMVKEIVRWRPIDPLGLPHVTSEEIWYRGYLIPKGSMLVPNVWAINRDPEIFGSDAHHFNPARHLDEKIGNQQFRHADTKDEGHILLINIVLLTWAAYIDGEHGPDGRIVGLDVDACIDEGIVVRPVPFPCNIRQRLPGALELLQHMAAQMDS